MRTIQDFLVQLNQNSAFHVSGQNYFKEKVDLYLKPTILKNQNFRQALIIGAGRMSDFSLSFFMRFFDKVVITDVDIESSKQHVDSLKLTATQKQKLSFKRIEYTGLEEVEFFQKLDNAVHHFQTRNDVVDFLIEIYHEVYNYEFLKEQTGSYDFIYVSPIYTQLIYQQLLLRTELYHRQGIHPEIIMYLKESMLDKMIQVINRFNDNLIKLLHPDGQLFVLSDFFEMKNDSEFHKRIRASLMSYDVMESIYQNYVKEYGMGIGDYGLYHLEQRLVSNIGKWLLWPLKKESSFLVRCKVYKKKNIEEESI